MSKDLKKGDRVVVKSLNKTKLTFGVNEEMYAAFRSGAVHIVNSVTERYNRDGNRYKRIILTCSNLSGRYSYHEDDLVKEDTLIFATNKYNIF